MQNYDKKYMRLALKQAKIALKRGEVPIGAVIVRNDNVIAKGYNQKELKQDVTKHAEMLVIQKASKKINNWRLNDCTLYVTLKPCNMCTGAINQSRISRVVVGTEYKNGGSTESHSTGCEFEKNIESVVGILENECKEILQKFFKNVRKNKDS